MQDRFELDLRQWTIELYSQFPWEEKYFMPSTSAETIEAIVDALYLTTNRSWFVIRPRSDVNFL